LQVELVFAELERERTSERTKKNTAVRRVQGLWFGHGSARLDHSPADDLLAQADDLSRCVLELRVSDASIPAPIVDAPLRSPA
jgi:DNA invertase Pin-like site-specific DNA recombinase